MTYKEEKKEETKIPSIDSLIIEKGDIEPIEIEVPDYSYGASQEPLNAEFQVRNLNGGGGKVKTGKSFISGGYTDVSITGVGFKPKAIQVTALTSSNKVAWGYGDEVGGTLTQRCIYSNAGLLDQAPNRLFRFSSTEVGLLVSFDNDGFTVKSDTWAEMIWTCFG